MVKGNEGSLKGFVPFPVTSLWITNIWTELVDPNSDAILRHIGLNSPLHPDFGSGEYEGHTFGIPYVVVDSTQAAVPVTFTAYGSQSDPGPMPIPKTAPVEGGPNPPAGSDQHVLVVDKSNCWLYELYQGIPQKNGSWKASSGAIWDLESNEQRPYGWTSADAAGLPILPGLVRYDEVAAGAIHHALRFTVPQTRAAFVAPASHWAATGETVPMGMRMRLKADFDISGFSKENQVILKALKTYGMIVADNGSPIYLTGTSDSRWNNEDLHALNSVKASDFEVLLMKPIISEIPKGAAPVIESFAQVPIPNLTEVELGWKVKDASYLIVTPAPGPVRGTSVLFGRPKVKTTYRLVATNAYGRVSAEVVVEAAP
jgi:hypothetical protein